MATPACSRPGSAPTRRGAVIVAATASLVAAPLVVLSAPASANDATAGEHTIAEIQGTGSASPYAGRTVATDGVVTAAYPTGGFNGFYLQTGDTGGDVDMSRHHASDAVFVYAPSQVDSVRIGDHVDVSGSVAEYHGLTEIDASSVTADPDPTPAVKPAQVSWPRTDATRESLEGMLLAPQGPFTVADNYELNQFGEIGLASGRQPLWQPTDVADPHDSSAIDAIEQENAAKSVLLDDGSSWNYMYNTTAQHTPLPYLTQDRQVRVGEQVQFTQPVVLDYRYSAWGFQPTTQLTGTGNAPVAFSHTRTTAPAPTGGNIHLASFNVLNYFPTTGEDFVAAGGSCSWYDDIDGNHVTVDRCTGPNGEEGPRGAADDANLQRQQDKIVHAINDLGADIVSLEEIENSAKFGHPRDWAVARLVRALNAATGHRTWAYMPTPATAGDQSDEDVIRTAFIYRTASVRPVGASVIDDAPPFDVARDPLAQAWQPRRAGRPGRFLVIANHFKSKGSGPDDGTGQGDSNPQRIAQADEQAQFAQRMKRHYRTQRVFLSGDFNSYTREDPMQHLYDAGYTDLGSTEHPDEATYLYGGLVGSLDHVLANAAAMRMVTGAQVWNINSVEPVALEYSRHHDNVTDFYTTSPYRASDHDPLVVGIDDPSGAGHARR